jgi:hypothetical protein
VSEKIERPEPKEHPQRMTLFHLFMGVCFLLPVLTAVSSARLANKGFLAYVAVITLGLILGFGCAWFLFRIVAFVASRVDGWSKLQQNFCAVALLLSSLAWIGVTGFLGGWASSTLLRVM